MHISSFVQVVDAYKQLRFYSYFNQEKKLLKFLSNYKSQNQDEQKQENRFNKENRTQNKSNYLINAN